jgi:hypothetical protein
MSHKDLPLWTWVLVGLCLGLMDNAGWIQTYGYLLFGFCSTLGFTGTKKAFTAAAILASGAAVVHIGARVFTGYHAGFPWPQETSVRLIGGVLVAALAVTLGALARLCWMLARRLRTRAASKALLPLSEA